MNEKILALLKCFGDRYINCDNDQAMIDVVHNREDMVSAFNAIIDYVEKSK